MENEEEEEEGEDFADDDEGSVCDDDLGAEGERDEPTEEEEDESWHSAKHAALNLPHSMSPSEGFSVTVNRLVGKYALKYIDGEWDVRKIDASRADNKYRYKVESTRAYGVSEFLSSAHGRGNPSDDRWVLLVSSD